MNTTFAQIVRQMRNKKSWSVYDLAEKIGRTAGYVSKIEARGEIPSPDMIIKLAEVLGAKPEGLIELAKKEKSKEVSQAVQRKYDDSLALYRKTKKG